jgi:hypothetical protein
LYIWRRIKNFKLQFFLIVWEACNVVKKKGEENRKKENPAFQFTQLAASTKETKITDNDAACLLPFFGGRLATLPVVSSLLFSFSSYLSFLFRQTSSIQNSKHQTQLHTQSLKSTTSRDRCSSIQHYTPHHTICSAATVLFYFMPCDRKERKVPATTTQFNSNTLVQLKETRQ